MWNDTGFVTLWSEAPVRLGLHRIRVTLPVNVRPLSVADFLLTAPGAQKKSEDDLLFFVKDSEQLAQFIIRVRTRWLLFHLWCVFQVGFDRVPGLLQHGVHVCQTVAHRRKVPDLA